MKDYLLPVTCKACKGEGVARRLLRKADSQFRLERCICPRCEGAGICDLLGDKQWDTITVDPPPDIDDLFIVDEDSLSSYIAQSAPLRKLRRAFKDESWL
ncbi:MAG: hypothetical protein GWN86_21340, partial [Desulfobacterales bacterium]|nr:hypothetical protein [Desulfobacterales bacterium]